MSQIVLPATRSLAVPRPARHDRRDGVLAILGLALASLAFGAIVSGDPVPASDVAPVPAGADGVAGSAISGSAQPGR